MAGQRDEPGEAARAVLVGPRPGARACGQLPRRHQRVAHDNELPARIALAQDLEDARAAQERRGIVDAPVHAVVEIEGAKLLEMGRTLRRGEEPLADVAVRVHRPAYVEEEQNAEVRTARSTHLDFQPTRAARCRVDGAGKIELVLRSLANVGAQPPQGDLDLPRIE